LESIFPETQIQDVQVYVSVLKSGSLHEDILIKLIFGSQEKFDQFITSAREKIGLSKTRSTLFGCFSVVAKAKHISRSACHIPLTLNKTMEVNLFDYVNRYRLNDAQDQL